MFHIVFPLQLLLVYCITTTMHHVMIFTLLLHLSSVHSTPYQSFSFSHLKSQRTRMSHTSNIFMSLLILLSGDIQSSLILRGVSGVSSLNMCTIDIRSFTNPLHYNAIADVADTHNIDVFALTETWISLNTNSAQLFDAIPRTLSLTHLVLLLIHSLLQLLIGNSISSL